MSILQSGNVSPGHLAVWKTDGVIGDGGALGASQKVFARANCDFNSVADQPLLLPAYMTAFMLTGIIVTNPSLSLTTAAGGFYPEASKAGTPLVAAGQVYSSLTAAAKLLSCKLASGVSTTRYDISSLPDWAIYLALTTAQGAAATADVYLLGIDLS